MTRRLPQEHSIHELHRQSAGRACGVSGTDDLRNSTMLGSLVKQLFDGSWYSYSVYHIGNAVWRAQYCDAAYCYTLGSSVRWPAGSRNPRTAKLREKSAQALICMREVDLGFESAS